MQLVVDHGGCAPPCTELCKVRVQPADGQQLSDAEVAQWVAVLQSQLEEARVLRLCPRHGSPYCCAKPVPTSASSRPFAASDYWWISSLMIVQQHRIPLICSACTTLYVLAGAQQACTPRINHVAACQIIWILNKAANVLQHLRGQRHEGRIVPAGAILPGTRCHPCHTTARDRRLPSASNQVRPSARRWQLRGPICAAWYPVHPCIALLPAASRVHLLCKSKTMLRGMCKVEEDAAK